MAAVERDECGIRAARGHLLEVFGTGDTALGSAQEQGGAGCGKEVLPMVAAEVSLRTDELAGFEGKGPAIRSLAKRVFQVGCKAFSYFGNEGFACWRDSRPWKDEADVVGHDGPNIFEDECLDLAGMACRELKGIDASERAAEQDSFFQMEVMEKGFDVGDVVSAGIRPGVAGVAVAALVKRKDAPVGSERGSERREGRGFHQVAVQSNE